MKALEELEAFLRRAFRKGQQQSRVDVLSFIAATSACEKDGTAQQQQLVPDMIGFQAAIISTRCEKGGSGQRASWR